MSAMRLKFSLAIAATSINLSAHAAGFALFEQGASGLGNAYAGASAVAEDASTVFFNPAGMTYLEGTQVLGALHFIKTNGDFNDHGSVPVAAYQAGGEGGNLGSLAIIPNLFYKQDLTDTIKFGFGVSTPFGLKTEYNKDWLGRFQGVKSDLKTVNLNPSIAWRMNDQWSFGFGVSAMWAQAELTSAANLSPIGQPEAMVNNKGKDWGFGFNLGTIYQVTDATRIGVSYRSKVKQHLKGDVTSSFTGFDSIPSRTLNTDITADITLPETFSVSTFTHLDSKWDLLTDITWTRWSQFKTLTIMRDNGSETDVGTTQEHWNNTLRFSAALNYLYSDKLKLRTGIAYDQEAIDNNHRTSRIPGDDRIWLSFGASYKYTEKTKFDVGYAHLFIKDTSIYDDQRAAAPSKGLIAGTYEGSADILSVQVSHQF